MTIEGTYYKRRYFICSVGDSKPSGGLSPLDTLYEKDVNGVVTKEYVYDGTTWVPKLSPTSFGTIATDSYSLSNMDTAGDPGYFGYLDADGNWYIMNLNMAAGTATYVKGASAYSTAWTNRAAQSYNTFDAIF